MMRLLRVRRGSACSKAGESWEVIGQGRVTVQPTFRKANWQHVEREAGRGGWEERPQGPSS